MGFNRVIFPNCKAPRKWVVRKTKWPYPEGYGIMDEHRGIILDTGLTQKAAEDEAARLNNEIDTLRFNPSCDIDIESFLQNGL